MEIKDDSKIRMIYFSDEKISKQILIFDGLGKQIKEEQFGYDWDGFSLGDGFHLNDEAVRVYKIKQLLDNGDATYIIGPAGLVSHEIEFNKIKY
ncbi:hypothetical protein [Rossellomorea marisflavi]|uniref:hypothetical protein n=1 Tax=Rossellomorea marisflavi TaxID=189381 RepID=UPI00207AC932|nr:hypothetical protein [Rossellomorea marisflavi]USK91507.1 hypothetical protein LIT29_18635 [Rossellomorea marisflavi]